MTRGACINDGYLHCGGSPWCQCPDCKRNREMPIDAMNTDDVPEHPLAYYLSGPYGDLAQFIIDNQKRLEVLEAKAAPVQDSQT